MKHAVFIIGFFVIVGIASIVYFSQPAKTDESVKGASVSQTPALEEVVTIQPTVVITEEPMKQTVTPMNKRKSYEKAPDMSLVNGKKYSALIKTSKGDMKVSLYADNAPVTVNNFVFLAREGFYNDTVFHRIIKGFMIQGGDPRGDGTGSPGYRFDDEKITREYKKGTIAMANSGPNTNGSQFFIMHADYPLPKNYVIFGSIDPTDSESMKTLDEIATVPTMMSASGEQSSPIEKIIVRAIVIEEK